MGSGITRSSQRLQLARRIESMRPTTDAVHEATLESTQHGLMLSIIADATGCTEARALRWSAGADIPATVSERRAILATLQRLLEAMPVQVDRRRRRDVDGRRETSTSRTERVNAAILSLRAAGKMLCAHCMRNRTKGDVVCTSRNCRNKVGE